VDSISGAELLEELYLALTRYVVLPSSEAAVAVVLWIAATHGQPAWQHATRLRIGSPMKRCGKSRLLDVVEATCHKPIPFVDASTAAIFRSISEADPPTLVVDEADAIWSKKSDPGTEDFRKLLNAGFGRGRKVLRVVGVGSSQTVGEFPTFAMVAIAGIGDMPDTVTDRAVNIVMRRKALDEKVSPFRERKDRPKLQDLHNRLADWVVSQLAELKAAEPELPVDDRVADVWEPLVAIADAAGGIWPENARLACLNLSSEADVDDIERQMSLQLLSDLRVIFGADEVMSSKDILAYLHKVDGAPWSDWYGRLLNYRDLAGLLRGYGIHRTDVKIAGRSVKGYRRDDLYAKGWQPYLPPLEASCPDWESCVINPNCAQFKECCDRK
jgi:hypothetical protein